VISSCGPRSRVSNALSVEAQEVVQREAEGGDRRGEFKGAMRSVPVVAVEEVWEVSGALDGMRVSVSVGPLTQAGLDEALGLAVGSGSVGSGAHVAQAETAKVAAKGVSDVARAIVGHDALGADAQGAEVR